jgi:hypothetical protein
MERAIASRRSQNAPALLNEQASRQGAKLARIRKSGPKNARRPFQPTDEEMDTGEKIAEALEHIATALSAIDHNLEILAQHLIKMSRNEQQMESPAATEGQKPSH